MKTKLIATVILNLILLNTNLALSPSTIGNFWYQRRAEGSVGIYADPKPINNAIAFYLKAYKTNPNEANSVALLKCYYFKGSFVKSSLDEKKVIFNTGKNLGEKMTSIHPNSAPIKYWLAAHWGKWAKNYGVIHAAYMGVAEKISIYASEVISIDPEYNDAGGLSILGMLHLYAPYIPFVLTWPSNDIALQNLQKAELSAPTIGNKYCLAQAYMKSGNEKKAKLILGNAAKLIPRKNKIVEDRNGLALVNEMLGDLID